MFLIEIDQIGLLLCLCPVHFFFGKRCVIPDEPLDSVVLKFGKSYNLTRTRFLPLIRCKSALCDAQH